MVKPMRYVSVHHHSTFSYMDGFGVPETHVKRAAELGMNALAHTEHGNVSSHVRLEKAGKAHGVKPIFGCELYTAPKETHAKWHLTALAENQEGYLNLNRMVSASYQSENFYYWPTVSGSILQEFSSGLIVTSGCSDSLLSCTLLGGKSNGEKRDRASRFDMEAAEKVVRKFQAIFGDGYYLETQQFPELERTCTLNQAFATLSERTGVPLVATADCHYPFSDDNEMQTILHAAGRGNNSIDEQAASWEYNIRLTHPLSDKFILDRLIATGLTRTQANAAIDSTREIADRCNVVLPRSEQIRFPVPPGRTAKEEIWDALRRGWKFRYAENARLRANKEEYQKRIAYEMELVDSKDFIDYFLMLSEGVTWAKQQGIPVGPARGSAAASLVCYMLRITEVDPLAFPTMVFERFMDVSRADLPDVDLDFADDRRHEVRAHYAEVYGKDHVANIGNFVKYRGKNAINDVARVYRLPYDDMEIIKSLIVERSGGDSRLDSGLEDTIAMFPQAQEVFDRHPALKNAVRLEGNYRGMNVHAAGIVISNAPVTDTCAIYTREVGKAKHEVSVIPYDKKDAEYLGMLKADFLGLSTMGMIGIALKIIDMKLEDLYRVPLDDPKTLKAFKDNDVVGIFQFEGRATRLCCKDVSPDNFMELADINALSRPGPLFSGTTANYIDVKHGRKEPLHLHPIVDKVASHSKYQIIYQEQVLTIIRELGGFPVTKVADIRKIISQKLGEASFNTMKKAFQEGAESIHGVDFALSDRIWKFLVTSATYSFNVAHCISYSMLGFWCMWLKVHHPLAFYTAQLSKVDPNKTGEGKRMKLMKDAAKKGIRILPPVASISSVNWTADFKANAVRAGLLQIPGVGEKTAELMVQFREEWDQKAFEDQVIDIIDWHDFTAVKGIGPKTMDKIAEFCLQEDPFGVERLHKTLVLLRKMIRKGELGPIPNPTHTSDDIPTDADNLKVVWMGMVKERDYKDLIEDERARSGESVDDILARVKDSHLVKSCVLKCEDDGDEEVYLRFNRWNYPKFKRALESIRVGRDVVVVQGLKRKGFGVSLQVNNMMIIDPED